jgi:serine protease inhibitor
VSILTLQQDAFFRDVDTRAVQALAIPFVREEVEMLIVAPRAGGLESFESTLSERTLEDLVSRQTRTQVLLCLPKFKKFGARFELVNALNALGMTEAFTDGADFVDRVEMLLSMPVRATDVLCDARRSSLAAEGPQAVDHKR